MKRSTRNAVTVLALVGAGILATWALRRSHDDEISVHERSGQYSDVDEAPRTEVDLSAPAASERTVQAPEEQGPDGSVPEETPETPAAPPEVADLEAEIEMQLRVVDPEGRPVVGADIGAYAMRSESSSGTHFWYRGDDDPPRARTDEHGLASLDHWVWADRDNKASKVTLKVTHPDYVTFDADVEIGPGVREIVMQQGATVVVRGWHQTMDRGIPDLRIQVDWEAGLAQGDWNPDGNGAWSTGRMPLGRHLLRASHESEELGELHSEVVPFTLAAGDWLKLDVELEQAKRFSGELAIDVPRPVENAKARLCLRQVEMGGSVSIGGTYDADVAPDGTFEFPALPPGSGELFVLCRGWVSMDSAPPAEPLEYETPELQLVHPRVTVPQEVSPFIVPMEPTGLLQVSVVDSRGDPLSGATFGASPNVMFDGYGSTITPWREWTESTDENGLATMVDLPRADDLPCYAGHTDHELSLEDRDDSPSVAIRPGETSILEIVLHPKQND